MKVGIIGHRADKFTDFSRSKAVVKIYEILRTMKEGDVLISGRCPMGGIDLLAEQRAIVSGIKLDIKAPRQYKWDAEYGFKQRNLDIARDSDVLYVILVDKYPPNYIGRRFKKCYHCNTSDHVKSGACWTAKQAERMGKKVVRIVISQGTESG
jgi:hypothetical protein